MFVKLLLVALALTAIPSNTEGQLIESIEQWNELLKKALELFEYYQNITEADLVDIVNEIVTTENLTNLLVYYLDNHANKIPQEYVCIIKLVILSDAETQDQVRDLIEEVLNYIRLTKERDAQQAECDAIQPGTILQNLALQNCKLKVQHLELSIANSYAKINLSLLSLRELASDGLACVRGA